MTRASAGASPPVEMAIVTGPRENVLARVRRRVSRVVDRVNEHPGRVRFAHDRGVDIGRRRTDDVPRAADVLGLERPPMDDGGEIFELGGHLGRDDDDAGAGFDETRGFDRRNRSAANHEHVAAAEVEEDGRQGPRHASLSVKGTR